MEYFYGGKRGYSFILRRNPTDTIINDNGETVVRGYWDSIAAIQEGCNTGVLHYGDYAVVTGGGGSTSIYTEDHGKIFRIGKQSQLILVGRIGNPAPLYKIQLTDPPEDNDTTYGEIVFPFLEDEISKNAKGVHAYWKVTEGEDGEQYLGLSFDFPRPVITFTNTVSDNLENRGGGITRLYDHETIAGQDNDWPMDYHFLNTMSPSVFLGSKGQVQEIISSTAGLDDSSIGNFHIGDLWFQVENADNDEQIKSNQTTIAIDDYYRDATDMSNQNLFWILNLDTITHYEANGRELPIVTGGGNQVVFTDGTWIKNIVKTSDGDSPGTVIKDTALNTSTTVPNPNYADYICGDYNVVRNALVCRFDDFNGINSINDNDDILKKFNWKISTKGRLLAYINNRWKPVTGLSANFAGKYPLSVMSVFNKWELVFVGKDINHFDSKVLFFINGTVGEETLSNKIFYHPSRGEIANANIALGYNQYDVVNHSAPYFEGLQLQRLSFYSQFPAGYGNEEMSKKEVKIIKNSKTDLNDKYRIVTSATVTEDGVVSYDVTVPESNLTKSNLSSLYTISLTLYTDNYQSEEEIRTHEEGN